MEKLTVFTHKTCLLHDTGSGHPEQIARLEVILDALEQPEFKGLCWQKNPPQAATQHLLYAHDERYINKILSAAPEDGFLALDGDTIISPHSIKAALYAAGAVINAVDDVIKQKTQTAFCAIRPPGHHAEKNTSMGFCIFSNLAIGALYAVKKHGIKKLAIVDFDVHHGNGTENIIDGRQEILFISSHQYPFYPGSGSADDHGSINNIINIPLKAGSGSEAIKNAYLQKVIPALEEFKPELIMISAGFDAHKDDPLGGLNWVEEDYIWITEQIKAIAHKYSKNRIISVLEGGYNLKALASSVAAHVKALMS